MFWLFLSLVAGLKLFSEPVRPSHLYRTHLNRINVVQEIMHFADLSKSLPDLLQLLSNGRWPFDEVYEIGCAKHLNSERFMEIRVELKRHHAWSKRRLLLSSSCLAGTAGMRNKLLPSDIASLGSGYFFEGFPQTDDALPMLPLKPFAKHLKAAIESGETFGIPGLVQNCQSWWLTEGTPKDLYKRPLRLLLDHAGAWMAMHPICYVPKQPFCCTSDIRLSQVIDGLLEERPLFHPLADPGDTARWLLHLILVMFNFSGYIDSMGGAIATPIREHIKKLAKALKESDDQRFTCIRALINASSKIWFRERLRSLRAHVDQEDGLMLPDYESVKEILLSGLHPSHRARWTLELMMLYGRALEDPFWLRADRRAEFIVSIAEATPLEQFYWIRLGLENRNFQWAVPTFAKIVKANPNLQIRLMNAYKDDLARFKRPDMLNFLLECVPVGMRLKQLRCWFIGDWRNIKRMRGMGKNLLASGHDMPAFVTRYLTFQKHLFSPPSSRKGSCKLVIASCQNMSKLSFILGTALLHGIRLPWRLSGTQMKLLFGFLADTATHLGPTLSRYFRDVESPLRECIQWDAPYLVQRVNEFIWAANGLIPPLLTWSEFKRLLHATHP